MKKIFLLFGIAAFSTASAQQKELLDIQKHMQKRQEEVKKVIQKERLLHPPAFNNYYIYHLPWFSSALTIYSHTLANGNKVYLLSQDNMPCIFPDMREFNMPNNSRPDKSFLIRIPKHNFPETMPAPARPVIKSIK